MNFPSKIYKLRGFKMAIKDLEVRQGNVDITVEVVEKGEVREFQKFGNTGRVCNANVKDDTGEIKLTLWNEQIDQVNVGDKVHITNGYVNEFQGEKQLTTGKFGKMEVVSESLESSETKDEKEESETDIKEEEKKEEKEVKEKDFKTDEGEHILSKDEKTEEEVLEEEPVSEEEEVK